MLPNREVAGVSAYCAAHRGQPGERAGSLQTRAPQGGALASDDGAALRRRCSEVGAARRPALLGGRRCSEEALL